MCKILTQTQSKSIYDAMCALNNVNMLLTANIMDTRVYETRSGVVVVQAFSMDTEYYANQQSFALAYGLE